MACWKSTKENRRRHAPALSISSKALSKFSNTPARTVKQSNTARFGCLKSNEHRDSCAGGSTRLPTDETILVISKSLPLVLPTVWRAGAQVEIGKLSLREKVSATSSAPAQTVSLTPTQLTYPPGVSCSRIMRFESQKKFQVNTSGESDLDFPTSDSKFKLDSEIFWFQWPSEIVEGVGCGQRTGC